MAIDAEIEDIRVSGQAAQSAAEITRTSDPGGAISPVSTALPASRAASAVVRVGTAWAEELTAWRNDADSHGRAMIAAADRYAANDAAAAADISSIAMPAGPR